MHVEGDAAGSRLDFSAWSQAVERAGLDRRRRRTRCRAGRARSVLRRMCNVSATHRWTPRCRCWPRARHSADARARSAWPMSAHAYGQRAMAARLVSDRPHAGVARQWFRAPDVLALLPLRPAARRQRSYGAGLVAARRPCRRTDGAGRRRPSSRRSPTPPAAPPARLRLGSERAAVAAAAGACRTRLRPGLGAASATPPMSCIRWPARG